MTARMTTCHELTENKSDLKRIQALFMDLQSSATPVSLIVSWFLSPAKMSGMFATTELFTMLRKYVDMRRVAEPTSDAIDVLISDGETNQVIVEVSFVSQCGVEPDLKKKTNPSSSWAFSSPVFSTPVSSVSPDV